MELVTPAIGLIFWTTIVFLLLVFILKKFAWKPILKSIDKRNKNIEEALKAADKAKKEMESLNADNERILAEAKIERDSLLKEARVMKNQIVEDAKKQANTEAKKLLTTAKEQIENEKMKAITELKNHVADISIDIAEKILKSELSDEKKQRELVARALKTTESN